MSQGCLLTTSLPLALRHSGGTHSRRKSQNFAPANVCRRPTATPCAAAASSSAPKRSRSAPAPRYMPEWQLYGPPSYGSPAVGGTGSSAHRPGRFPMCSSCTPAALAGAPGMPAASFLPALAVCECQPVLLAPPRPGNPSSFPSHPTPTLTLPLFPPPCFSTPPWLGSPVASRSANTSSGE